MNWLLILAGVTIALSFFYGRIPVQIRAFEMVAAAVLIWYLCWRWLMVSQTNWGSILRKNKTKALIFTIAVAFLLDGISTTLAIQTYGSEIELNPLIAFSTSKFGITATLIALTLWVLLPIAALLKLSNTNRSWYFAGVALAIAKLAFGINNLRILGVLG